MVNSRVRILDLPKALWTDFAFDPHGRYIFAVGNEGRRVRRPARRFVSPKACRGLLEDTLLYAAAVSPSGRRVATAFGYGQGEKTLRVWDLETGESRTFELPDNGGTGDRRP